MTYLVAGQTSASQLLFHDLSTLWDGCVPFPFISVEWFDVGFLQETRERRLPARTHITDHSPWIEELLQRVGLEYQKGSTMIRIFGYSPKSLDLFDV
jgi:hypothetical protein